MRRKVTWALFSALALLMLGTSASVRTARADAQCTEETLKGAYGYVAHGSQFAPGGSETADVVVVGRFHSDGKGKVTDMAEASINGIPLPPGGGVRNQSGTYTVGANCAGEVVLPSGTDHFVIVERGEGFRFITRGQGAVGTGTGTRMQDEHCTDATLKGEYGYELQGSIHTPPHNDSPPQGGDIGAAGWIRFDGTGELNGEQVRSFNGATVDQTLAGTYSVGPDCTAKAIITVMPPAPPVTLHIDLVILERGEELLEINRDPGAVLAGLLTKVQHG